MRTLALAAFVVGVGTALTGCGPGSDGNRPPAGFVDVAESDDLAVRLEVPLGQYHPGEQFEVAVTAVNKTSKPMTIEARTGALVYVEIYRHTAVGWESVKRYPEAATMVLSPWQLGPGSSRTFTLQLRVEPDWPTNEQLRLTAELNGVEELSPGVIIEIVPTAKGPDHQI